MGAYPGFIGGAYLARSRTFDGERCLNLYPEKADVGTAKNVATLIGTPGLRPLVTAGSGPVRGCIAFTPTLGFVVSGTGVYSVSTGFAATLLAGGVDGLTTPVSMASNGMVVMLVTGPNGYVIDPGAMTVTQIADPDFAGADNVYFEDGYFIFNKSGTGQFQISELYGTTIDGLDFATAEGAPDNIIALAVDHREVWLFGTNSTEVWYDSGDVNFPFARIQGAFLEIGCAARFSVAKMDNSLVWLATDDRGYGTIQRAVGYTPQRISTHAIEFAIASYSTISDAIGLSYSQEGHLFYQLTFPTANRTWVFDAATALWHERAYRDPTTGTHLRHRANCQMNFAGLTVVGDYLTGDLYAYDLNYFTDNGATIVRRRTAPHLSSGLKLQFFDSLQIDMETGVGLTTGQGSTPQAMLRWSNDGGFTWSNEYWVSIGKIGGRRTRAIWRRLGCARDRVFEVTITDPVKVVMIGAELQATAALA